MSHIVISSSIRCWYSLVRINSQHRCWVNIKVALQPLQVVYFMTLIPFFVFITGVLFWFTIIWEKSFPFARHNTIYSVNVWQNVPRIFLIFLKYRCMVSIIQIVSYTSITRIRYLNHVFPLDCQFSYFILHFKLRVWSVYLTMIPTIYLQLLLKHQSVPTNDIMHELGHNLRNLWCMEIKF